VNKRALNLYFKYWRDLYVVCRS